MMEQTTAYVALENFKKLEYICFVSDEYGGFQG
jgi:CBS domain containing-hemolysin-like protein